MSENDYNEEIDELTQVSMNILMHAGNARDNLVKAFESIHNENFEEAKDSLKKLGKKLQLLTEFKRILYKKKHQENKLDIQRYLLTHKIQ